MVIDAKGPFVAIDFEIANARHDSACAVGLAAGKDGRIVRARSFLIRPPSPEFVFTEIHGLRWEDVRGAPTFGELLPQTASEELPTFHYGSGRRRLNV